MSASAQYDEEAWVELGEGINTVVRDPSRDGPRMRTTAYIILGATLEERDFIEVFGKEYRDYRKRVAMLIPWRKGW